MDFLDVQHYANPSPLIDPPPHPDGAPSRVSAQEFRNELVRVMPALRRFAGRYCRRSADADDAVQTTCERALVRWQQWSGCGKLEHWLISILINARRDQERTFACKRTLALDTMPEREACSNTLEFVYLDQVRRELLLLPGHLREALMLVACQGLSYRDAAKALGVPIGTVMSRLSRAREALRVKVR